MRFAHPDFLYALPTVWLALGFLFYWERRRRRHLLKEFAGTGEWTDPGFSRKRLGWDRALSFGVVTMLFLTLARPMYFSKDDRSELQGVPYIIALDASRSMLATDVKPSRFAAATNALDQFFSQSQADRIGFITFSGVGYLNAPLTFDTVALRTILRYIDPNTLIDPGSSPASALDRAERFFASNSLPERVVILISDGEEPDAKTIPVAARLHREQKLIVHTIGVGTATGGRLRLGPQVNGQTNRGPEIVTKLDETNLRRIANVTGGRYYRLGENGQGLRQLREEVLRPLAEQAARNDLKNYRECFYAPLIVAIVLLLLQLGLGADRFLHRRPLPNILRGRS